MALPDLAGLAALRNAMKTARQVMGRQFDTTRPQPEKSFNELVFLSLTSPLRISKLATITLRLNQEDSFLGPACERFAPGSEAPWRGLVP